MTPTKIELIRLIEFHANGVLSLVKDHTRPEMWSVGETDAVKTEAARLVELAQMLEGTCK